MRDYLYFVIAILLIIAVGVGVTMFFADVSCSSKADLFGTQYRLVAGGECYLKLNNDWVPENMYGLAKSFKD